MSIINLAGLSVSENSYRRARAIVEKKRENSKDGKPVKKTAEDVLASIRQMKPGWTVSTTDSEWGPGARNLQIGTGILERMAEDPEAMIRYKALILDLEELVPQIEEWKEQNEGKELDLKITVDENGVRAMAKVRTLLGAEMNTSFKLPTDGTSWADLIRQKLDALSEGQTEDADGSKSWQG